MKNKNNSGLTEPTVQTSRPRIEATQDELVQLLRDIKAEARYNTKWNTGEPEPNPSKFPTLTPVLWYRLCAALVPQRSETRPYQMQASHLNTLAANTAELKTKNQ